ncbi:MAG: PTS sugar transporter subunit IIA [Candidatus Melainabacteria bacterium HGW-Melainabacteria-1]|nr:MAG: PTS sugar transporter subunit IIA [Candidatus Melainabacteria bacterium HGW-Melainabacteria-1]
MILQKVFQPSAIKTGLESENKEELFEELVDVLARSYAAKPPFPRQKIIDALTRREAKMSTGIAKGIALPHATVEGLDTLRGVLGISSKGIDYDALDGHPVFLVFMLLSPPDDAESHLHALQRMASLIDDPHMAGRLAASASSSEAFALLKEFDSSDLS